MKTADYSARIEGHIEDALASALSSMTGKEVTVTVERKPEPHQMDEPIVWEQSLSFDPEPVLWLVAGKSLWSTIGQLTLAAAGVDSFTDEDCRSTWQEIVGQTIGGVTNGLTSDLQSEITASNGAERAGEPPDLAWTFFSARHDENKVWYLKAAWSPALTAQYEGPDEPTLPLSGGSTFSKTFDLLLDVALPVCVSFGKTSLQIREVLKLNTGSIVELNRLVVEPVDVIVNDCVIARGEVVVVDGNYGVRVTQIASREDRLRTGMAGTTARVAAAGGGTQ